MIRRDNNIHRGIWYDFTIFSSIKFIDGEPNH